MGVRSGKLREVLTFQTKTETSDGLGAGGSVTWSDTLTGIRGELYDYEGREGEENNKRGLRNEFRLRVRYHPDIVSSMRIYHPKDGDYYEIVGKRDIREGGKRAILMRLTKLEE